MTSESPSDFIDIWAGRFGEPDGKLDLRAAEPESFDETVGDTSSREVSPLEWVFLGLRPEHSVTNYRIQGRGSLRLEQLHRAVARVSEANPGSRPVRRDRRDQSNFHQLGGGSLSLLAGVSREILPTDAEQPSIAELPGILREPTLDRVAALARQAGATT